MDEEAAFETRAVLGAKRSRVSRLALLVPAVALVATAWAGLSGAPSNQSADGVDASVATQPALVGDQPSSAVADGDTSGDNQPPGEALGLEVHKLDEIDPGAVGDDDVLAIEGWFLATEITDCPPLAAIFRQTASPDASRYVDSWRFCKRSGVLFATQPMFKGGPPANDFDENRSKNSGLPAIDVMVDERVVMPAELELIGGDATPVVVLGRLLEPDDRCHWPMECPRQLVVDHIAWTPE
jgi:hypothetical protein